jgi:hypothetical protein
LEYRCVPATITPTTFDDGGLGSGSLRDAVLQFNADTGTDDDIIQLLPGTYTLTIRNAGNRHETAGLTGDLNLTQTSHRWIIQGAGPSTIIDASQLQDRVFQIVNPGTQVVFQDLVIQGGLAQDDGSDGALAGTTDALGGGILNNDGDLALADVVIQNNVAQAGDSPTAGYNARGGGLYSTGGALTISGTMIGNNQAFGGPGAPGYERTLGGPGGWASGGGLYASGGSLDISDSRIASNRATGGRGGDGYFYSRSSFSYTVPGGSGGDALGSGLYVSGGSLTITSSTIDSNQGTPGDSGLFGRSGAVSQGGGLYILSNAGMPTVSNSTLSGNTALLSGGIYNSGTLTVSNSTLSGNSGGGISSGGTLTVSNSTLSGNSGGGISNGGTSTVSNSTLSGNGFGISNAGTLTVSNSTLSGNTAYYGIINSYGTLTVSNSTVSGNGGGIFNYLGTVTVSNSTLSGNSGGGIYNAGGALTVSNSTLSGNTVTGSEGYGGGIFTFSSNPITLTNVTLTANRATNGGGGLYVHPLSNAVPVLHNTLIAGNFRGATDTILDDVYGSLNPSSDYNLIGDGTGMTGLQNGVNGNLVGSADAPIDPLLDSLGDYGGPTRTHALLPGSPALNVGDPNQMGMPDQRGVVRSGGVNIGAYQASATAFVLSAPDTVQSGVPFDVSVKAVDPFGQVAVGYIGTVTFRTSDHDPGVVLPADYSFQPSDAGQVTFPGGVTLITPGDQTLSVMDTADYTITGSALITVGSMAPGAGSHGREGEAQPSRLQGSAPPTSEPSHAELVAGDHWFAALNERDLRFTLVPPMYDAWTGGDWWALDSWWGGEPLLT